MSNSKKYRNGKTKLILKTESKKEEKANNNIIIGTIKIENDNDIKE